MHEAGRAEECICVLQLTEAGDVFYQILEPDASAGEDASPRARGRPPMQQGASSVDAHHSSELEAKALQPTAPGPQLVPSDGVEAADDGTVCTGLPDTSEAARSATGDAGDRSAAELGGSSLLTWKRWLQKLMRRSRGTKSAPHASQHVLVGTKGLLRRPADDFTDPSEEQRVERLRQELTKCMCERSLLVRSAVSASLGPPEVVPLPHGVEPDAWTDDLSQRLTASWQGDGAWHSWWKEKLGLDREQKAEAVRRKRRREKEARRASGHHLELSDSFSSSASCLSEWDNFSEGAAASQAAWCDSAAIKEPPSALTNPSSSCPPLGSPTPTEHFPPPRQRRRRALDSYLSSQVRSRWLTMMFVTHGSKVGLGPSRVVCGVISGLGH